MLLYKSGLKNVIKSNKALGAEAFDFSKNTTYGLGGLAECCYYPQNLVQARRAFDILSESGKPFEILGAGSNVLVSDSGLDGGVISTKKLKGIVGLGDGKILCLAGTKISELLSYCKKHGLGGLEYMYGIPATVGGAVNMNAGVCGKAIGDNVVLVRAYGGFDIKLTREICDFGYRHSTMRDINAIILSIILKTEHSTAEKIMEQINFYKARRAHLPVGRSCGCVFKNPENYSAGYLIENAGLKGVRRGGAVVSSAHANFIINEGGSAEDARALIRFVKDTVFRKFGVALKEEVVYIGEFNDFNC